MFDLTCSSTQSRRQEADELEKSPLVGTFAMETLATKDEDEGQFARLEMLVVNRMFLFVLSEL